jgi:hypothetical protein
MGGRSPAARISSRPRRESSRIPRCCCSTSRLRRNWLARLRRPSSASPRWTTNPTRPNRIPRSPPAPCSRKPIASWASRRGGRCRWQSLYENRSHYLHAHRLDQSGQAWRSRRPATWSPRNTARNICRPSRGLYQTKVKNAQEAHEAIRPAGHPFDFPEQLRGEVEPGRVQALRPDLETDRRQPDGRRPRPADHDHARRGGRRVPSRRQDDRFSRLSAGLRRRQRRSGSGTGRKGHRAAQRHGGRSAGLPRAGAQGPHDPAAVAIQRSRSPGRWKKWASAGPAPTPRSSTRSRRANMCSRRGTRWCPRGWHSPWPSCWKPICRIWSIIASRPRWKTTWTPSAAARRGTSIIYAPSTSATARPG